MSAIDDEPEPTEEELRAAAELARALDAKRDPAPGSDAAFAAALKATRRPEPLAGERKAQAIERAMVRGASASRARTRSRWLAAAAAVLLAASLPIGWALSGVGAREGAGSTAPSAAFGGPTDALFAAPFPDEQRASERMDRIATARAHDYFAVLAAGAR